MHHLILVQFYGFLCLLNALWFGKTDIIPQGISRHSYKNEGLYFYGAINVKPESHCFLEL